MESFIKRGIVDGVRLCYRQKIRNFQPYHEDRKVIAERLLQSYSNTNFLKGQQCLLLSQKTRLLSVNDPSIQKYLSNLSNDRSSIMNDKFLDFQSLNSLLNQREQVLMSVQTVNELQQGAYFCSLQFVLVASKTYLPIVNDICLMQEVKRIKN